MCRLSCRIFIFIVIFLVFLDERRVCSQIIYDNPIGGSDQITTWRELHEFYWQAFPAGEVLFNRVDFMHCSVSDTRTVYFLFDKGIHRLVTLMSDGWEDSPQIVGKFFGPSSLGDIVDLDVYGATSNSHIVTLCDISNNCLHRYRFNSSGDGYLETLSHNFGAQSLERPRLASSVAGEGSVAVFDRGENDRIVFLDTAGMKLGEIYMVDVVGAGARVGDIEIWKSHEGSYNLAVVYYEGMQWYVRVLRSDSVDFSGAVDVLTTLPISQVREVEYEPHMGLVVLHEPSNISIYTNTGVWEAGMDVISGGAGTLKCLATANNHIHAVSDPAEYGTWIVRGRYLNSTSISVVQTHVVPELEFIDVNYRINYPGTYTLHPVFHCSEWGVVAGGPIDVDFSVGEHNYQFNANHFGLADSFTVKFVLSNYNEPTKSISRFTTDLVQCERGPSTVISSPGEGFGLFHGRSVQVEFEISYADVLIDEVTATLQDEYGNTVDTFLMTDVTPGTHSCSLTSERRNWPCGRYRTYSVSVLARVGQYSRTSLPLGIAVHNEDCPERDPLPELQEAVSRLQSAVSSLPGIVPSFRVVQESLRGCDAEGVRVYDLRGRVVYSGSSVGLGGIRSSSGVYFLKIDGIAARRLVLVR